MKKLGILAIEPCINNCTRRKVVNFTSRLLYSQKEDSRKVLGLFLISNRTPPSPVSPPSDWLGLFSSQTFSRIYIYIYLFIYIYQNDLIPVFLPAYTANEDGTDRVFRNVSI